MRAAMPPGAECRRLQGLSQCEHGREFSIHYATAENEGYVRVESRTLESYMRGVLSFQEQLGFSRAETTSCIEQALKRGKFGFISGEQAPKVVHAKSKMTCEEGLDKLIVHTEPINPF